MKHFPLFYCLKDKTCLVVGGGTVALRRARALAAAGARLEVIAPQVGDELVAMVRAGQGRIIHAPVNVAQLDHDYRCIIAATNNRVANAAVVRFAKAHRIPVNVADDPAACDFIFPALIERQSLTVALANSGGSPVLSRLLKQQLDAYMPAALGELSQLAGKHRAKVNTLLPDEKMRTAFWERVLQGPIAQAVYAGQREHAEQLLHAALRCPQHYSRQGEVYLLGAGPGDPDLLTLRAFRLLQQADVVVYDALVSAEVIALAKPTAELIAMGEGGEEGDQHTLRHPDLTQRLVAYARHGKRVACLRGANGSVLEPHGEDIAARAGPGITVQVVPGINAANGCGAPPLG